MWWKFFPQSCKDHHWYFPNRNLGPTALASYGNTVVHVEFPGSPRRGFKRGEVEGVWGGSRVRLSWCQATVRGHSLPWSPVTWPPPPPKEKLGCGSHLLSRERLLSTEARLLEVSFLPNCALSNLSNVYTLHVLPQRERLPRSRIQVIIIFPCLSTPLCPSVPSFNFRARRWAILNFISCEFMIALCKLFRVIFLPTLGRLSLF